MTAHRHLYSRWSVAPADIEQMVRRRLSTRGNPTQGVSEDDLTMLAQALTHGLVPASSHRIPELVAAWGDPRFIRALSDAWQHDISPDAAGSILNKVVLRSPGLTEELLELLRCIRDDDVSLGLDVMFKRWDLAPGQCTELIEIGSQMALAVALPYLSAPEQWIQWLRADARHPAAHSGYGLLHWLAGQGVRQGLTRAVIETALELQVTGLDLLIFGSADLSAEDVAELCWVHPENSAQGQLIRWRYLDGKAQAYTPTAVKRLTLGMLNSELKGERYQLAVADDYAGLEFVLAHLNHGAPGEVTGLAAFTRTLRILLGDSDWQLWDLALDLVNSSGQTLYEACQVAHLVNGSQIPATWLDPHQDLPVTEQGQVPWGGVRG